MGEKVRDIKWEWKDESLVTIIRVGGKFMRERRGLPEVTEEESFAQVGCGYQALSFPP